MVIIRNDNKPRPPRQRRWSVKMDSLVRKEPPTAAKSDRYEPAPCSCHKAVVIGGNLCLWAGLVRGLPRVHDSPEKRAFVSSVDVFHLESGDWVQQLTSEKPPLGVIGYACAAVGDELYYFGGDCGHDGHCYHNGVHKLSTSSLQWVMLSPTTSEDGAAPMKKAYSEMVAFKDGEEDILFVVGGCGPIPSSHQPGAQYKTTIGRYRSTNEQHMFTLSTRKWSSPEITGQPPPPCESFTLTPVGERRAALFGGMSGLRLVLSDLFIVDLNRYTVHWTMISKPSTGLSATALPRSLDWPKERCGHAATCVSGPLLVIMGGLDSQIRTISDCWIYDLTAMLWQKLPLPKLVPRRVYHSLSTLQLSPHTVWLIVFGGQRSFGAVPISHTVTIIVELFQEGDGQWKVGRVMEGADLVRQYQQILSEGRRRGLAEGNKSSVEHQLHQQVHQLEDEKRQLQQTQTRTAHVMEQVTTELVREKEQIQLQSDTRTEELQHLRTEKEQLQTANTRSDEQICQLQQQVQQQQQQTRVISASEMEQVMREKEQEQHELHTKRNASQQQI